MKAYSYIRFSTPQQAEGDSLRRQLDLSDQYATKHNLEIDDSLRITDLGKSAYKEKHLSEGALGEFLKAVEAGEVERGSYLLVESLDRLSRACVPKALRLFLNLLEHGIKIVTLGDERCYSEQSVSKDMTEMIISIAIMSRAHEESQRKAQRVAAAWQAKRDQIGQKKLSRNCPRWLRLSEDRKSFVIIPERVKLVKEIFDLTIEGLGRQAIATRLNRRSEPVWNQPRKPPGLDVATSLGVVLDAQGESRPAGIGPDIGWDEFRDADTDGLPDWVEALGITDPAADFDNDGLSNLAEYQTHLTDLEAPDSDGDGLFDGVEVLTHGTNPLSTDSDSDGMADGWEITNGLNPLADDAQSDLDDDGPYQSI